VFFLENGPYRITQDLTLTANIDTWNSQYNLLFLDNPVGSGFSYVQNKNGYVTDEKYNC